MSKELYEISEESSDLLSLDCEKVYLKKTIRKAMKDEKVDKIEVERARPSFRDECFYCSLNGECYTNLDDYGNRNCGKSCSKYNPKNGKSGCCKHKSPCYSSCGEIYMMHSNGKMEKINK